MLLTKEILRDSPMWQEIEQEGRAEGRMEGRVEGERLALRRILARRFGSVPAWADEKIAAAGIETLERWIDQSDASTLPAVLD